MTKLNKQAQIPEGKHVEISCREVIRELSKYIDQDLDTDLRVQIEAHLADCKHCTAIYDGIRNVITLMGDDRSFDLPAGFSQRLRNSLTRTCR
ncbi:MAG TPA: zf-HC2 domain-containing protein [Terriglobales bacterium]|nr:zf-HC2 domain-containing protein [Terriglobales bacterium]